MGSPEEAGTRFLETIAPPESDRTGTLLGARQRRDADGQLYYELEFRVKGPSFHKHNVAVYGVR